MADFPMQPMYVDPHGVVRFKPNKLVEWIIDSNKVDMNTLAMQAAVQKWPDEDQAQFAQLIGYSVSGWGDLSYVSPELCERADDLVAKLMENANG